MQEPTLQVAAQTQEEGARLRALARLDILDTAPEPEFDELVQIAAAICGTPISLVSLIDEERQWFKAAIGFDQAETPRNISFCDHAIRGSGVMLVEDATQDPRFAHSPLVTGETGVRFYAGVPVADPEGQPVGTLCVLDTRPRTLSPEQRSALRILASQVNARLELRLKRRELEQALADAEAAHARLAASEQRFSSFINTGPFLAYSKDRDGRMLFCNRQFAREFELSGQNILGKTDAELWPADLAPHYRAHDLQALHQDDPLVTEEQTRDKNGNITHWRSWKFRFRDAEGQSLLGGISVDLTAELRREAELHKAQRELEAVNQQLTQLAAVDALTGLANRRAFDERLKITFRQSRRAHTPLSVLLLDVDDFKQHNDLFGHGHGDEVLRTLGKCFRENLRADDLPARYGGEEFAVLLPDTDEANALLLAERLLHAIRSTPWAMAPVTISIGLSALTPAMADTNRLMTLADEALYAAKRAGKNCVVAYSNVYKQAVERTKEQV